MSKALRRYDPIAFRAACLRSRLTIKVLAQQAGLSAGYVAHVRIGVVPSEEIRNRIAQVLGVDVDQLWPLADF
jgi:transcriptional regulator with XRE-family HTH domain